MTREKREDYIYSRAYELAATGLHLEPITIVSALIKEGYPEAAEVLDNPARAQRPAPGLRPQLAGRQSARNAGKRRRTTTHRASGGESRRRKTLG